MERDFALAAIFMNKGVLVHMCAHPLLNDNGFALEVIQQDGSLLKFLGPSPQGDPRIVMEAMKHDVRTLDYACGSLLADREFLLAAVRENKSALAYLHSRLPAKTYAEIGQSLRVTNHDFAGHKL